MGEGQSGSLYLATHTVLNQRRAVKILSAELSRDERFRERFEREARLAASLDHPHILPLYDAGEYEGRLFLAMRYIEGENLKQVIETEGKLPEQRAVRILVQIASALDAAHKQQLVHRDVKPSNVLLTPGQDGDHAYLTDFALTKELGSEDALTRTGVMVGTLEYISPEQIEGRQLDARTDVYALGCLLYQMLTGDEPFPREGFAAKLWAHMNDPPPAVSDKVPQSSPRLDGVIVKAMAKDAGERYSSASEFAEALVDPGAPDPMRDESSAPVAPVSDHLEQAYQSGVDQHAAAGTASAASAAQPTSVSGPRGASEADPSATRAPAEAPSVSGTRGAGSDYVEVAPDATRAGSPTARSDASPAATEETAVGAVAPVRDDRGRDSIWTAMPEAELGNLVGFCSFALAGILGALILFGLIGASLLVSVIGTAVIGVVGGVFVAFLIQTVRRRAFKWTLAAATLLVAPLLFLGVFDMSLWLAVVLSLVLMAVAFAVAARDQSTARDQTPRTA